MRQNQESRALTPQSAFAGLTEHAAYPDEIKAQVQLIQQVMRDVMKEGEHYGKIPGCGDKPALLKPGAEKLMLTFRLSNDLEVEMIDLPKAHREYRVKVTIYSPSGQRLGTGIGSCSTMETKYRFRAGTPIPTDKELPRRYWDLRDKDAAKASDLIGGKGFVPMKLDDGKWVIAKVGGRVEHDNPADHYNTTLKMAKKRGLVDAVLTSSAASDIFTQDIEEDPELHGYIRNGGAAPACNEQSPAGSGTGTAEVEVCVSESQLKDLKKLLNDTKTDQRKFLDHFKVQKLESFPAKLFGTAMQMLKKKEKPAEGNNIVQLLRAKNIPFEMNGGEIQAKPDFTDKTGQALLKSKGFKWNRDKKVWALAA